MSAPPGGELEALARLYQVQPTYVTADGERRTAHPDAVLAVLRALGAPVEGPGDVPAALRAAEDERARRLVPPVAVHWQGQDDALRLHLREEEAGRPLRCHLFTEAGDTLEWDGDLSVVDSRRVGDRRMLEVRLALPRDAPAGYHDLRLRAGGRDALCRLIVAPPRAWAPEGNPSGWGAFLPLHALRTARTPGVADLTDLEALERWTAELGGEVVGTLPLLASFLDRPFEPSPYAPVSRLFWNELWLDPERSPGWGDAAEARRRLAAPGLQEALARERARPQVDYRKVARLKRSVLEALTASFAPEGQPLPPALALYAEERPEALSYARFRAACEKAGAGWPEWDEPRRGRALREEDHDEAAVRYHLYAQWAMEEALAGLATQHAGLYLDLPLGTHAAGYDTWRFPELFAAGVSAGAPPDPFFAGGQDWGFPPLRPERLRESRYAYWVATLRTLMRASSMLRLDHVMGLHRLYWVPRGFPATEGVYVRYPAEELYAALCIESHRHRCEVVGEDLGTVPAEVRETMARRGLRRMYVLPFELDVEAKAAASVPPSAVASLGTHDTAPWAGFWEGRDVEERVEDGQLDPERAPEEREGRADWRRALLAAVGTGTAETAGAKADQDAPSAGDALEPALRFLAASPARLVLVSLEDLWGETEPQNRPGTTHPDNWRRRAALTLEAMREAPAVRGLLQEVDALRREGAAGEGRNDRRKSPEGSVAS